MRFLAAPDEGLGEPLLEHPARGGPGQPVDLCRAFDERAAQRGGHLRQQTVEELERPRIDAPRIEPEAHPGDRPRLPQRALDDLPRPAPVNAGQRRRHWRRCGFARSEGAAGLRPPARPALVGDLELELEPRERQERGALGPHLFGDGVGPFLLAHHACHGQP